MDNARWCVLYFQKDSPADFPINYCFSHDFSWFEKKPLQQPFSLYILGPQGIDFSWRGECLNIMLRVLTLERPSATMHVGRMKNYSISDDKSY